MSIGQPRPEDLVQADRLERRLATSNPEELAGLRWMANVLRKPVDHWRVDDTPRTSEYEDHQVLDELGDLHASDPRCDSPVLVPVRVVFHGDIRMEVGPYDLGAKEISVLRRAIASYDRIRFIERLHGVLEVQPSVSESGEVADE